MCVQCVFGSLEEVKKHHLRRIFIAEARSSMNESSQGLPYIVGANSEPDRSPHPVVSSHHESHRTGTHLASIKTIGMPSVSGKASVMDSVDDTARSSQLTTIVG
jgi:hypothetical protein